MWIQQQINKATKATMREQRFTVEKRFCVCAFLSSSLSTVYCHCTISRVFAKGGGVGGGFGMDVIGEASFHGGGVAPMAPDRHVDVLYFVFFV